MTQMLVLFVGSPASGKSTEVERYLQKGCVKLSRDVEGGSIPDLLPKLEKLLSEGKSVVLDNTFPTAEVRKPFIEMGKRFGVEVRCHVMRTSIEDAQYNACSRMVKKYGRILTDEEMKKINNPNMFPVSVLFSYRKRYEEPTIDEGFKHLAFHDFNRWYDAAYMNKAILLDYDGTLRETKSGEKFPRKPSDVRVLPGRVEILKHYKSQGYRLIGISNQSGIAKGDLTEQDAKDCFAKTNELLGLDIDVFFCPHKVPPISCYCRKPGVGLGILAIEKHHLNPMFCTMVGDLTTDKTFAKRCGFKYQYADDFFSRRK